MGVEIAVPLGSFAMIIAIVWIAVNGSSEKRKATLKTVDEAIRAGQKVTPEMIKALGMPAGRDGNGDLKWGLILLAIAASFVFIAFMVGEDQSDEAFRSLTSIASFPGFIGLVLVGFGLMNRNKNQQIESSRTQD